MCLDIGLHVRLTFFARNRDSKLANFLRSFRHTISKPKAIVIFSAHWESGDDHVLVNVAPNPSLYFDYYGFPKETYELKYPAPGSPDVGGRILSLLGDSKIKARKETKRGWDHGVFVPLTQLYPDADVPIVQVSVYSSLDPLEHIKLGRALAPLRDEGVLLLGSGALTHNLPALMRASPTDGARSKEFMQWLLSNTLGSVGSDRSKALAGWKTAPHARFAHPREEHLIPLFVVLGAAEEDSAKVLFDQFANGGIFALHCLRFG